MIGISVVHGVHGRTPHRRERDILTHSGIYSMRSPHQVTRVAVGIRRTPWGQMKLNYL